MFVEAFRAIARPIMIINEYTATTPLIENQALVLELLGIVGAKYHIEFAIAIQVMPVHGIKR